MTMPMRAPVIVPDHDTKRPRYPSHDTTPFTPTAHGSCATTSALFALNASVVKTLAYHSTAAAVIGAEMLSSRRTGSVSTSAAAIAATTGAMRTNDSGGGGVTAGRVHHASATAPTPPHMAKATVPAAVFSRFHGICRPPMNRPAIVAKPSPNASTPHAAATMSS